MGLHNGFAKRIAIERWSLDSREPVYLGYKRGFYSRQVFRATTSYQEMETVIDFLSFLPVVVPCFDIGGLSTNKLVANSRLFANRAITILVHGSTWRSEGLR